MMISVLLYTDLSLGLERVCLGHQLVEHGIEVCLWDSISFFSCWYLTYMILVSQGHKQY